jgi:glycerophosphoryl diester phosphodiesterase
MFVVLTLYLCSDTAAQVSGSYPWLAGLDLDSFPGPTRGAQIVQAAHAAGANILSPYAKTLNRDGASFTTKEMVDEAHKLGLGVLPWTVRASFEIVAKH